MCTRHMFDSGKEFLLSFLCLSSIKKMNLNDCKVSDLNFQDGDR